MLVAVLAWLSRIIHFGEAFRVSSAASVHAASTPASLSCVSQVAITAIEPRHPLLVPFWLPTSNVSMAPVPSATPAESSVCDQAPDRSHTEMRGATLPDALVITYQRHEVDRPATPL